jgi:UDP-2,3-diacylglucosamine hydrolase
MRISAISDVHIRIPYDEADKLLMEFLSHPLVVKSDYVLLLGDIFDLMCGPHRAYLNDFQHIFTRLDELMKSGVKVFYCEGNHDVHLEALFKLFWPNNDLVPLQTPIIEEIEGKSYYFSHGDEHEVDNLSYQKYKKTILSAPLRFVANRIMPYAVLNMIGRRASMISRKKGARLFDEEAVKRRFREGLEISLQNKRYDFVLGGHSHVRDIYQLRNGVSTYVNNGYALRTRSFISINNHEVSFENLA